MASDTSMVFNLLATDRVTPHLARLGAGFDRLGARITGFARLAVGAFVGAGIIDSLRQSVAAASDLNEAQNKIQVLFGSSTAAIQAWSAKAATGMGMSTLAATDAAATMGVFGKAAGLTGQGLVKFSTQMAGLSSDLASFYNTSPEEAMQAIGAALRGESEPIRRYGILLDDASLRQQAFAMHLTKTTKNVLTPQQRVLAAQALILKQSSAAQGDFARTSGGLANQQRILAAELTNSKAQLGAALLPAMVKIAGFATSKLVPAFTGIINKIQGFSDWISHGSTAAKIIQGVLGGLAVAVIAVTAAVKLAAIAQGIWNAILALNPIVLIVVAVIGLVAAFIYLWKTSEGFRNFWKDLWKNIKTWAIDAKDWVVNAWNGFIDFFKKLPGRIASMASGMWDGIKNAFRGAINWLIGKWNGLEFTVPGIDFLGIHIDGFTLGVPDIPYLAKGGNVLRTGLAVVHEGEQVMSARTVASGGAGQTVRVVIDIRGADGEMKRMIRKMVRVDGGGNAQVAFS